MFKFGIHEILNWFGLWNLDFFLNKTFSHFKNSLHIAVIKHDIEIIKLLLSFPNVDINHQTVLFFEEYFWYSKLIF